MKRLSLFFALMTQTLISLSQQENYDKVWVQGLPVTFKTTFTTAGPVNQFWDSIPPQQFAGGHSNICNGAGDLLLATDGAHIYNGNRQLIDNGDSICSAMSYDWYDLFPPQSTIMLPLGDSIYYVFLSNWSDSAAIKYFLQGNPNSRPDQILYSIVDMKLNNYAGKVVKKRQMALDSAKLAGPNMTAVRHGNGKDWWVVKHNFFLGGGANKTYAFLVKSDTVIGPMVQAYPNTSNVQYFGSASGQSAFNNTGTKYVAVDEKRYLFMADFDRCTGLFSNGHKVTIPGIPADPPGVGIDSMPMGVCFSPNDSFLYMPYIAHIVQWDINDPDTSTAWMSIGGIDTTASEFNYYRTMYMGHDKKIYIGNQAGFSDAMSAVSNPNVKGLGAGFCPKCLRFPLYNGMQGGVSHPPNMPNYVLGIDPACPPDPNTIATIGNGEKFSVYPNPAANSVTIETDKNEGRFKLFDMAGRLVISEKLVALGSKTIISTAMLPDGMYIYRCYFANNKIENGKLLISK